VVQHAQSLFLTNRTFIGPWVVSTTHPPFDLLTDCTARRPSGKISGFDTNVYTLSGRQSMETLSVRDCRRLVMGTAPDARLRPSSQASLSTKSKRPSLAPPALRIFISKSGRKRKSASFCVSPGKYTAW